jgi:imidazolonepropionase-like amidohydrolase
MQKSIFSLRKIHCLIFISLFLFAACTTAKQSTPEFAITNVNLITMENETVLPDRTVLIGDGKILAIDDAGKITPPQGAQIIDGQGKYLVPGLAEMHAHIPQPRDSTDTSNVEETLFLYLSNGITTIRGMLGAPYHLKLREQVKTGEIFGPRIYTSGPSLNGRSVQSDSAARAMVRAQKTAGYDFLKLHPGLTLENFNAIAETAAEAGITFAGHVSTAVGVRRAIAAKYASIDHLDGYVEGLVPEEAGVDPAQGGFFGYNFTNLADESKIAELVQATKDAGVWIVPTESLMEHIALPGDPEEMIKAGEYRYVSPRVRRFWVERKKRFLESEEYNAEQARRFIALRRQLLKAMHDAGVRLLLGSDAPQIFNVPGFSIQHELQMLVAAGLSPYQALRTGTVNPARFFNAESEYGTVAVGKSADLILLDANPLEDIGNVAARAGVMVRGKWLPEQEIQARLAEIAGKYVE